MFKLFSDKYTNISETEKDKQVLNMVIIVEHVILVVIFFLRYVIRNKVFWVSLYEKRKLFRSK